MISNDFTSHSSGQVILFRNGVINNINIVYSFRRIRITEFEMVSKQIAVGNVYVPAGSRQKYLFKMNLLVRLIIIMFVLTMKEILICMQWLWSCKLFN